MICFSEITLMMSDNNDVQYKFEMQHELRSGKLGWCFSMLKRVEFYKPNLPVSKKQFIISLNPSVYLDYVMS